MSNAAKAIRPRFAKTSRRFQFLAFIVAAIALALNSGCGPSPLKELDEARRLAADLRLQFSKGADASNRAVIASTDEAASGFAREAEQLTRAVETDVAALAPLLERLGYSAESQALARFVNHFAEYRKVDRSILELAVENTNLKAQELAFGPGREAADDLQSSLETMAPLVATKDRCRVDGLVSQALLAVRQVQVIQAPHIAESDDAAMTRLEKEMAGLQSVARAALGDLQSLAPEAARAPLSAAGAALDRFDAAAVRIITLSRRNSDVRSFDLALRTKPPLSAACDDSLRALQDALAKDRSKATR